MEHIIRRAPHQFLSNLQANDSPIHAARISRGYATLQSLKKPQTTKELQDWFHGESLSFFFPMENFLPSVFLMVLTY